MNPRFIQIILDVTQSSDLFFTEEVQQLWSGYGKIIRYRLEGGPSKSVVVKLIRLRENTNHPRGYNSSLSHQRKLKSYEIETNWYSNYSKRCDENCYVPHCFGVASFESETLVVLEDLDLREFSQRRKSLSLSELVACLSWLANFHATFLGCEPKGLWPIGSYWHLATRPDELDALEDQKLKNAAPLIDSRLNDARYQTLIHGDAKVANFCFHQQENRVAAVDFQYVGRGCGMKDLAYLVGSCRNEEESEEQERFILDTYFSHLAQALNKKQPQVNVEELEREWRSLYYYAWADFHRFLKGWSPNHHKINSYSERICEMVLAELAL